jgi:hypothetical protein
MQADVFSRLWLLITEQTAGVARPAPDKQIIRNQQLSLNQQPSEESVLPLNFRLPDGQRVVGIEGAHKLSFIS